ncbi:MAG: pyridoxamine 5'-phosphate oxidase family protein [Candidatus Lambdaproteobacteria bacterium]|nr:pyridoxamine 5'-phosphate oxidase family protein [Candidatus Lambdaproteobacteria bacterium]
MLPNEIKPALQGAIPSVVATCSIDGTPNATVISQVYYVDEKHVALSYQFFNKTVRNVRENPYVALCVVDPNTYREWYLEARFDHSETEGPVFDAMDMQIEAIASMTGMTGIFKLKAADIYEVLSVRVLKNRANG